MVKLEGERQCGPKNPLSIASPEEEGIVENAAVHADGSVDLGLYNGGGTDHHTVRQVVILAVLCCLACQAQIIGIESRKIV